MDGDTAEYDVALTFAGEDRQFAHRLSDNLKSNGLRVFYDEDFKAQMWGENLVDFLEEVYAKKSMFVVMLISHSYIEKHWTTLERRSAQDAALAMRRPYILPVQLDSARIPGLHSTTAYLDARIEGVEGVAKVFLEKFALSNGGINPPKPSSTQSARIPQTDAEISSLLETRPDAWEYLLFAGRLRQEIESREAAYLDFEIGYTPRVGQRVSRENALEYLKSRFDDFFHAGRAVERILGPDSANAAFGEPGTPGDPGRISHLALRLGEVYQYFMDIAAELRAAALPGTHAARAARAFAKFSAAPINDIRKFNDEVQREFADLPDRVQRATRGEIPPIELSVVLRFNFDDALKEEFLLEYEAAQEELTD